MRIQPAIILFLVLPIATAQDKGDDDKKDARYNAVLWSQVSPEYAVALRQTYWLARLQLAAGMADENHTADEQQAAAADYQMKPPAIILDVDETVLDNSAYNARNIQDGAYFQRTTWNQWVDEATAPAIPGAVEFIKHAQEKGVVVFLVTNRRDENRDGTLKNIKAVGLEVPDNQLLLRNDDAGRGGDKVSRRAIVAKDHRIILLIGDNIADLCNGTHGKSGADGRRIAAEKQKKFGNGWVMLPNPVYGGWERAGGSLRTQRANRPAKKTTSAPEPKAPAIANPQTAPAPIASQPAATAQLVNPKASPPIFIAAPTWVQPQCNYPCCRCYQPRRRFNSRR